MVKVNLRDGRTVGFDLLTDDGLASWKESQADPSFQKLVTGAALLHDGWIHTLPLPPRFRATEWDAYPLQPGDKVTGEVLTVTADDVVLTLTVYHTGVSRIDLRRREWRQRFAPVNK